MMLPREMGGKLMKKRAIRSLLAIAFTLCLLTGMTTAVAMEDVSGADFQLLRPVLDLVANAAISASDFPAVISDEMSTLDQNFVTFFFNNGAQTSLLGITDAMLSDTAQQEQLLKSIFSAKLPALEADRFDRNHGGLHRFPAREKRTRGKRRSVPDRRIVPQHDAH